MYHCIRCLLALAKNMRLWIFISVELFKERIHANKRSFPEIGVNSGCGKGKAYEAKGGAVMRTEEVEKEQCSGCSREWQQLLGTGWCESMRGCTVGLAQLCTKRGKSQCRGRWRDEEETDILALLRGTLSLTEVSYKIMIFLLLSLQHDCRCTYMYLIWWLYWSGPCCACVVCGIWILTLRPLLTSDPNQNPKTYFWIGFDFGQLMQKRCYRFLENPKCCQPPIYCDTGWQNHYKKSKIFLLDYSYKWNIMIPIWEIVSFPRNLPVVP